MNFTEIINWFRDYLIERKQRVVFNGSVSGFTAMNAGVPLRIYFRPLIILNTVRTLNCNVRLLADDTTLCVVVENSAVAAII